MVEAFSDVTIGAVCGRKVLHAGAGPIAAHARLFNYGEHSSKKRMVDASRLGVKATFLSNSFNAYRRSALMDVGGFPSNVILGEDQYVGGEML